MADQNKKPIDFSDLGGVNISEKQALDFSDLGGKPISPESALPSAPPAPEEQIGGLEAGARGAAKGLTFGLSPRVLAAGQTLTDLNQGSLLDKYNRYLSLQKQREELAAKQHPIIYHGSELAAPLALGGLGALGEAGALGDVGGAIAEGAQAVNLPGKLAGVAGEAAGGALEGASPLVSRLGTAATEGAALGGAYGAGGSEDLTDLKQTAANTLGGAKTGALLGGALGAAGAGAEALAQKGAQGEGLLADMSKLYLKGLNRQDISDFDKISQQAYEYGQLVGNKSLVENVKVIKAKFNALQEAGEASGQKAALDDILSTLDEMKQKALENADPDQQKTINQLTDMLKNKAYGLEQEVMKPRVTQEVIPGQEATPSSQEAMQSQVDELNADAKRTSSETGEPLKTYSVVERDGKLNIKEVSTDDQGQQSAKLLNKEWQTPEEGQQAVEPSVQERMTFEKAQERPGEFDAETGEQNPAEVGMKSAVGLEKEIGGMKSEAFNKGEYRQGKILSDIDKMITDKVDQIEPGYAEPREQWKNMLAALDKAGINQDKMLDLNIEQAGDEALNDLKPKIMQKINQQILKSQEPGYEGIVAKEDLDRFFNYLEKSGVKDAQEMKENLTQKMQDYSLSQKMQPGAFHPGIASHNPKVEALSFLKSYGRKYAHEAGLAQSSPLVQNVLTMAPGAVANSIRGSAPANATPMENFSRNLSYSNPEQAKTVAQSLKSDPNLSYLGDALDKAITNNDQIQKNAIIFAISQNPTARKYLGAGEKEK